MEKYLYILQKSPLFKQIKDTDTLAMLKCLNGRIVHYKKNKIIFFAGDTLTSIGVILSGTVQITNDDIYGNRTIISELKHGSIFAEAFAYANLDKIPVSVIATLIVHTSLSSFNRDASSPIEPFTGVNLAAFPIKLVMTCPRR